MKKVLFKKKSKIAQKRKNGHDGICFLVSMQNSLQSYKFFVSVVTLFDIFLQVSKFTFRHLKKGIQEFHRKFVLAPADKAANNVVVV